MTMKINDIPEPEYRWAVHCPANEQDINRVVWAASLAGREVAGVVQGQWNPATAETCSVILIFRLMPPRHVTTEPKRDGGAGW